MVTETYERFRFRVYHGETSCVEEVERALERISASEHLGAFVTVGEDEARRCAEESDIRFRDGKPRLLEGMIVAVKDLSLIHI